MCFLIKYSVRFHLMLSVHVIVGGEPEECVPTCWPAAVRSCDQGHVTLVSDHVTQLSDHVTHSRRLPLSQPENMYTDSCGDWSQGLQVQM